MTHPAQSAARSSGNYTLIGLLVGLALAFALSLLGNPGGFGFGFGIAAGVLGGVLLDPSESRNKRIGAAVLLTAVTVLSVVLGR
ncbi:MAG: hypothetical protein ACK54L_13965 [Betaproteobacteria bacterium]